ncbi:MAG: M48 family metallopeptidase [Ramlibacter sp.]
MAARLAARWFDGRSSGSRPVLAWVAASPQGPTLSLLCPDDGGPLLVLASDQVDWPEAWGARTAPRALAVDLGDHGTLQVDDAGAWHQAQRAAGLRPTLAQRMLTGWPVLLAVLAIAACCLGAFYRWGTPWVAAQLTEHVPLAWEIGLSERGLHDLDTRFFQPSRLSPQRQQALRARFDVLAGQLGTELRPSPGYAPPLRLAFRSGLGANALALPGGQIIVTDGLVDTAARQHLPDDAIVGVLAHEIGHVAHRHTTRMLVEQGVLNVGLGLALGDVSTLVSSGASLLTGLAYQRGHEAQADCFALALLRRAGLPTAPTGDLLLAIDDGGHAPAAAWTTILSSHPGTAERAAVLKAGLAPDCR